jgi:hypothetical protein
MGFWRQWRAERELRKRAAGFTRNLLTEPADDDVRWLAEHGTGGDLDHARWELRYARRALGLLTAERDALDDRTGSLVARELAEAFARDPLIASAKREVAERQFNARLRTYGDVLATREREGTGARLGRALLAFAGRSDPPDDAPLGHAGDILAAYLEGANETLRRLFGTASLPEDIAPSAVTHNSGGAAS